MEARITALLGSLLILGGCHRAAPPGPGSVEVVFSVLGEAVRATGTAGEAAVDSWTLLLYRDGRLAEAVPWSIPRRRSIRPASRSPACSPKPHPPSATTRPDGW